MKSFRLFQKAFSRDSWRSFPCEWIFNRTVSIEICRLSIKCLTLAEYNYSLYYNTAKNCQMGIPGHHSHCLPSTIVWVRVWIDCALPISCRYKRCYYPKPKENISPLLITVSSLSYILQDPLSCCQYHIHLVTSGLLELT